MSIPLNFNYQEKAYEFSLEETKKPLEKVISIDGRDYKILGSEESLSLLKSFISTLEPSSFENISKFKASLKDIDSQSKIKPVVAEILSSAFVEKSTGVTENIPLKEEIDSFLQQAVIEKNFRGTVLVIQKGKEILKQGYGQENLTSQTLFHIGSITKPFTAAMILELHQQKKLSIDDPINHLLPIEFQCKEWKDIKVKHLLNHTSGIPNFNADPGEQKEYQLDEIIQIFKDQKLDFEPGSGVDYCNSGYVLLGAIIEKMYGKPFSECIKERILDRFDMKSTGFGDTYDKETAAQGYEMRENESGEGSSLVPIEKQESYLSKAHAAGAIYSNLDDLQKFDAAFYDNSFLTPETRELMFTPAYLPGIKDPTMMGLGFKVWNDEKFNLGLIVFKEGYIPGFNTMIQRYVESNSCTIVLSNNGSLKEEVEEISIGIEQILAKYSKNN